MIHLSSLRNLPISENWGVRLAASRSFMNALEYIMASTIRDELETVRDVNAVSSQTLAVDHLDQRG